MYRSAINTPRIMKIKTTFVIFLCLFSGNLFADIDGCSDGNTCYLRSEAYTGNIKLFCVQSPALNDTGGNNAHAFLTKLIKGTITVLIDRFDDHGNLIAELIRDDGLNVGLNLVESGHAKLSDDCTEAEYLIARDYK